MEMFSACQPRPKEASIIVNEIMKTYIAWTR